VVRFDSLGKALLAAVLLCASCGGGSSAPPLEAADSVVAAEEATDSLGFDVDRHGWTFGNYAASGSGLFGVADAVALFGDAAVCVEDDGVCTPTPAAAEWIDMVASSMQYGVCEGMTVASVDRFLVGANPETGLVALTNELEHQLARLFATQFLDDVIKATERWRTRSVAEIVTELQASLADPSAEQYTLGVYSKVGGHSVLPYAVDLDAAGRGVVYVYDPNWPGEERYIEVDTQANRWRFSYFSSDQVDDPEAWTGGNGLMDLTPLSVREAPFPEPFKGSGTGVKQLLAISSSTRNWTLTNADGGVLDGQSVVPGRDGVVAITRGAPLDRGSQRTDVVLVEWVDNAELKVLDGAATLSLFTDAGAGSVVVSDEATIKVEVPADPGPGEQPSGLEIQVAVAKNTEATVTVASATERVRVTAEAELTTSVQLTETSTKIGVTDAKGAEVVTVEVPRSAERVDIVVDRDGEVETFTPESIDVEERIEAVEKSAELLVANDIKSRTVEVTSVTVEKVEAANLRVDTVDKVDITTTTLVTRLAVTTDSEEKEAQIDSREITENEIADIHVDEAGESATLLLADGSKVEVRISSNGDVVTSDGRTVDITIKLDPDNSKKEAEPKKEPDKSDESLDKKATTGGKDAGSKQEATKSDREDTTTDKDAGSKQEATKSDREDTTTDKDAGSKQEATKSDREDTTTDKEIERKEQATKSEDSAKSESKTDDRASDSKLDDRKR
jgi:hypothetical protein